VQKKNRNAIYALFTCLAFMLGVLSGPSVAQEKTDTEKLLNEIAGDYEFEYEGQVIVFVFSVEDGKLIGAPEGEAQEVMEAVEGEEMTFVGISPDGIEYIFKFKKNEEGEVSTCTCSVPAMGLEIEGVKIKG
jgi:hypothetical protein